VHGINLPAVRRSSAVAVRLVAVSRVRWAQTWRHPLEMQRIGA
jgi:hypothetical protein